MNIYLINGAPCSGKTTFEETVQRLCGQCFCKIVSSIDFVKVIAKQCGWDGTKTPENRKFLADLKELLVEWDDVPLKKVKDELLRWGSDLVSYGLSSDRLIAFVDVREPSELDKFKKALNAKTILINRDDNELEGQQNISDSEAIFQYRYDIVINNNGALEDLENIAKAFIKENNLGR